MSTELKVSEMDNLIDSRNKHWDLILEPKSKLFDLKIRETIRYRDLLAMFVKREIITVYKQTILGPLWFLIQPILTTVIFTVVFGNVAKIPTDGVPPVLFYISGITLWNYFAESLRLTSDVFKKNEQIFGKVYFPRVVVPMSIVISNFIKFLIQFVLFLTIYIYFVLQGAEIKIDITILLLPILVLITGVMSLGFGLIISSMTSKYRDLTFLVQFGVQLFMYATPIVYPISIVGGKYKIFLWLNPMTSLIETFRFSFTGSGEFNWVWLVYSSFFAVLIYMLGLAIFNRTERNFMDTV